MSVVPVHNAKVRLTSTEPLSGIFIDFTQVLAALGDMMPSGQNTRVKGGRV